MKGRGPKNKGGPPRGGGNRGPAAPASGGASSDGRGSQDQRRSGRRPQPQLPPGLKRPDLPDQLEGRNVVLAALQAGDRVRHVWIDDHARPEGKVAAIRELALDSGARVVDVPRAALDAVCTGDVHNGVVAFARALPSWTLKTRLQWLQEEGIEPFLVLLDQVQYQQNLGAILRTAAIAGAHAVVVPTRRGAPLGAPAQRVAMGGAEVVPMIRESMTSALATLRRAGIRVIGAEADGDRPYYEADFTGPLAVALGGEDRGLGSALRQRCDEVVAVPMPQDSIVTSLNVSVTAGLLLFERVRQRG